MAPETFSASGRPHRLRQQFLDQAGDLDMRTQGASLGRDRKQTQGARIMSLVQGVPVAGDGPLGRPVLPNDLERRRPQ